MSSIGKIIESRRKELGLTLEEVGNAVGVGKSTVKKWETGYISNMRRDRINALAKILQLNPNVLIDEKSESTPTSDLSELYEKYPNIKPIKKIKIPMLGKIACGEPTFADEGHETYIETDGHIQADFCLTCAGDSMLPKIENGDIVFIRKQEIVDDGQIAAVIIGDEATLKRVYYDKPNNILQLIAENPKYKPLVYSGPELDQVHILGRAVSLYRKI